MTDPASGPGPATAGEAADRPDPPGERGGDELPLVSVIIPCRNERNFIAECLDSVLANDYPAGRTEVLVVDGRSGDGTREIVARYAEKHERVRLVDNPRKITPAALNRGIKAARGEVIVRMDAHTLYPEDYVRSCVAALERHGADNVGGCLEAVPAEPTPLGRALAAVSSHPFGVGGSWFRVGVEEPREVDTVPFGCYRREIFQEVGTFDEDLERSQDYEFNQRLRRTGGTIVLDPRIRARYLVRASLLDFARHRLRDGFWAAYPLRFGKLPANARHLTPGLAAAAGLGLVGWGAVSGGTVPWLVLATLVGLYLLVAAAASTELAFRRGEPGLLLRAVLGFAVLHACYGLGTLAGLGAVVFRRFGPPSTRDPEEAPVGREEYDGAQANGGGSP